MGRIALLVLGMLTAAVFANEVNIKELTPASTLTPGYYERIDGDGEFDKFKILRTGGTFRFLGELEKYRHRINIQMPLTGSHKNKNYFFADERGSLIQDRRPWCVHRTAVELDAYTDKNGKALLYVRFWSPITKDVGLYLESSTGCLTTSRKGCTDAYQWSKESLPYVWKRGL